MALSGPLAELLSRDFVFEQRDGELEYVFRHATLQEVAYSTLLTRRRQALHRDVAAAMLALYSVEEHVDIIAYHYAQTEEHAQAAMWLERSGDRAAAMYANQAAIEQIERRERGSTRVTRLPD